MEVPLHSVGEPGVSYVTNLKGLVELAHKTYDVLSHILNITHKLMINGQSKTF